MPKKVEFEAPNRIRQFREARKLTLEQLTDAMDKDVAISLVQLARLERGDNALTYNTLSKISKALEVLPADLLLLSDGGLTQRERMMIEVYRSTTEAHRLMVDALINACQVALEKN